MPKSLTVATGPVSERYTITNYAFIAAPIDPQTGESDPMQGSVGVSCVREVLVNDAPVGAPSGLGYQANTPQLMAQLLGFMGARMAARLAAGGVVLTPEQIAGVLIPAYLEGTREALYDLGQTLPGAIPAEAE